MAKKCLNTQTEKSSCLVGIVQKYLPYYWPEITKSVPNII